MAPPLAISLVRRIVVVVLSGITLCSTAGHSWERRVIKRCLRASLASLKRGGHSGSGAGGRTGGEGVWTELSGLRWVTTSTCSRPTLDRDGSWPVRVKGFSRHPRRREKPWAVSLAALIPCRSGRCAAGSGQFSGSLAAGMSSGAGCHGCHGCQLSQGTRQMICHDSKRPHVGHVCTLALTALLLEAIVASRFVRGGRTASSRRFSGCKLTRES